MLDYLKWGIFLQSREQIGDANSPAPLRKDYATAERLFRKVDFFIPKREEKDRDFHGQQDDATSRSQSCP